MAKILKRLLLIIPILFLFPKNVFADTNNIYFNVSYNKYQFDSFGELDYTTYNFNALDTSFTLNYYFSFSVNDISYVLYDKVEDTYVLMIFNYSNNSCLNSSTFNFTGGGLYNASSSCNLANRYIALLSNKDESTYLNGIFNNSSATFTQNGNFYLTQNGLRAWDNYMYYIVDNTSNFEEVYKNGDYTLLFNNVELEKKSSSSPEEPEPEDPEEDMPILNYNQIKYYVPNYEDSQCIEVLDKDTIRVFNDTITSYYTDYYVNNHYISKIGQVGIDYEKNCSTLKFTSDYKYRNDFPQICFITLVVIGFTILPCYMLFKVFYKRG